MRPNQLLTIYVIFERPLDYPQHFVVAAQAVTPGGAVRHGTFVCLCDSLDEAREQIPFGCVNVGRYTQDEPQIRECWM